MSGECGCCVISCPAPTLEHCWPPNAYQRAASYPNTGVPDPYVVPSPESEQYFDTKKLDYTGNGIFSYDSTYYDANEDENVSYMRERVTYSGGSHYYRTKNNPCGVGETDSDTVDASSDFTYTTEEFRIHSEESGGVVTYTPWTQRHRVYTFVHVGDGRFEETDVFTFLSSPTATPSITTTVHPVLETADHPLRAGEFGSAYTYVNTATSHSSSATHTRAGWDGTTTTTEAEAFENGFSDRYRFVIPHDFDSPPLPHPQKWHGTYHKIELEETFTPDVGSPIVTAKDVEWTGPGDELDTWAGWGALTEVEKDARRDSWKTAWIEVDPPEEAGEITVSLYRSQCYEGAPWVYHESL